MLAQFWERSSSSEPSGTSSRIVYWTGSTLAIRSCAATKSISSSTSRGVVHGSEGHERGPGLDPVLAQEVDREHRLGGGVALVQADEDLVVDALQRADDEQAARGGHLLPYSGALEHVLDLRRAVKGQLRETLVHAAHDLK